MKKEKQFFSLILICLFAFGAAAQQPAGKTDWGVRTSTFDVLHGTVTVDLPESFSGGDQITSRVVREPKGKNTKQQQKNEDTLNGYVVEIENGDNTSGGGFLKTVIPAATSGGLVHLLLKDPKGNILERVPIPVRPKPAIPSDAPIYDPVPGDYTFPDVIQTGRPAVIYGSFDGDVTTTTVEINDREIPIIAESPDMVVFESPEDITGPVDINLREGDMQLSGTSQSLDISMNAGRLNLKRGESTTVNVTVSGLEGRDQPVQLELTNLTPGIVTMQGGNTQIVQIPPVQPGGIFTGSYPLTASVVGGFSVQGRVFGDEKPIVQLVYPTNNMEVPEEPLNFAWKGMGLPEGTSYLFSLWQLDEEGMRTGEPVFRETGITEESFALPEDFFSGLSEGGDFEWGVDPEKESVIISRKGKGKFKKGDKTPRCKCETISLSVRITNTSNGNTATMNANAVPVNSRTHRFRVYRDHRNFRYQNGNQIKIEIQNIQVKCTCETANCNTRGTNRSDRNRSVSIDLGENDGDASNDNFNFRRTRNAHSGWQADGSFDIYGQVEDHNSNTSTVYQTFTVKTYCSHANCSGDKYCHKRFSIIFGRI